MKYFENFPKNPKNWIYFGIDGLLLYNKSFLNIGFGIVVFNSIWEHGLNVFLNIFSKNKKHRSVNNFRTKDLFDIWEDLGSSMVPLRRWSIPRKGGITSLKDLKSEPKSKSLKNAKSKLKCLGRFRSLGGLGVCRNHRKWLQLRAFKIWCKPVRKAPISWPKSFVSFFFNFYF